jgi:hypothetical protein
VSKKPSSFLYGLPGAPTIAMTIPTRCMTSLVVSFNAQKASERHALIKMPWHFFETHRQRPNTKGYRTNKDLSKGLSFTMLQWVTVPSSFFISYYTGQQRMISIRTRGASLLGRGAQCIACGEAFLDNEVKINSMDHMHTTPLLWLVQAGRDPN